MKKIIVGVLFTFMLVFISLPVYGSSVPIEMDGVTIKSDTAPQMKNSRTMVPLRTISESLGAQVDWSDKQISLSKGDMNVTIKINSKEVIKVGEKKQLDAAPYIENKRTMVPLRFIAETFGARVDYQDKKVYIKTKPLIINGEKVDSFHYEYRMTLGGVIEESKVNSYNQSIYNMLVDKQKDQTFAPMEYGWMNQISSPDEGDHYYKNAQLNFKDVKGNDIQEFGVYSILIPYDEELGGRDEMLLHDVTEDQWYVFEKSSFESIKHTIISGRNSEVLKEISNTVV